MMAPEQTTTTDLSALSRRLTDGESPEMPSRAPFELPEVHSGDPAILKRGTQVLLLAATQTERDAVLERLKPSLDHEHVLRVYSGAQTYYVGRLGSVDVVLTTCRAGSQPRDGSTLVTHEAIGVVGPRAVVVVGMAFGGYTEKLRIGDVLVSTHVIPYEQVRKQASGDIHRGGEPEAGALLVNRFLEARGWRFPRPDGYECKVREGRMLTGEKLVDSLEFKTELFAAHQEAIGGEMEGSGVYGAAARCGISEWIIVKAVCDWADGTKHKEHQPLAATSAVALVEHVFGPNGVLDDLQPFRGRPQETAPGAQIVVSNVGTQIGTQNVVHGDQSIVVAQPVGADGLLDAIQTLINKGHLDEAGARIDEADTRMSSQLTHTQKARLRALRATRKLALGDTLGAARDFLQAHDLSPDDEKAPARRCRALLLQDQNAQAFALARATLTSFPNHPYIRPMLIASAPSDVPVGDLLPPNWRQLGLTMEEAVAAFHRVRTTDTALAQEVLRKAHNVKKEDSDYWTALASILDERILGDERDGNTVEAARRDEVIEALKNAYASILLPTRKNQRGHVAFGLAIHSKRIERLDEYKRWLAIAKELIPDSDAVLTERAQEACDRGDFKAATELLRGLVEKPGRPDLSRVVFSNALLKLGTQEAIQEAFSVLEQAASDTTEPPRDRRHAAMRLVEAQMDLDRSNAAASIERHRETLGEYGAERLRLVLAHECGEHDTVVTIAKRLISNRQRFTRADVLDFGCLLRELGLNEQCVEVLETIAPRKELGPPTIALLNAANATRRFELVGNICRSLRNAGIEDNQIIDGEACVLLMRGDLSGALDLVTRWLASHPNDKRIRFRQAQVAYELGRKDLLPARADELPEPTGAYREIAPDIVRFLLGAGQQAEARRFAYANFKAQRRSEWAWKAMFIAGLPNNAPDAEDEAPRDIAEGPQLPASPVLSAGPGVAVRIKERNSSRWIQLEESDDLVTADDEYGPTHPITLALSGKKVGERIELQKGQFGFPPRVVEIEAITSCFNRICQDCSEQYELQFPGSPFLHSFHVPDSIDEFVELLLAGAKERHDSIDEVVKAYGENPRISLHGLATLCQKSIFEVIPFLVSKNSIILAARPPERMKAARESLQRTREIIVETTAISTLAMLEQIDRLKPYFTRLWIARATVDRLRAYVHRTISDGSAAYVGLEGEKLLITRNDPAFATRRANYLRGLLAAVETWDVFDETERDLLSSKDWDNWAQIAGGGTADSVHRAKRLGVPLWTDDVGIAAASEHEGATPISTQAVFETLASLGIVTRDELAEVGARLVGWRYLDTRTPPESFLAAARVVKWDAAARPLAQHMELLTSASWPDHQLAIVVAEVFRLWWIENSLHRAAVDSLILAAVIRLVARENGQRLVKLVLAAVHKRFGLDVIGAQHVAEVIIAWMATQPASR